MDTSNLLSICISWTHIIFRFKENPLDIDDDDFGNKAMAAIGFLIIIFNIWYYDAFDLDTHDLNKLL